MSAFPDESIWTSCFQVNQLDLSVILFVLIAEIFHKWVTSIFLSWTHTGVYSTTFIMSERFVGRKFASKKWFLFLFFFFLAFIEAYLDYTTSAQRYIPPNVAELMMLLIIINTGSF